MKWKNRIFRKEAQKYRTWNSHSARLRMRLTFSTIIRIRYRDVFRPLHLFSPTNVVLTFKYYTNLRLQILSFWYVIYHHVGTRGGGGGVGFQRPWADFSQTLSSLSNDDGGENVSEKVNSRCFSTSCNLSNLVGFF